jgi:hypothetical protein
MPSLQYANIGICCDCVDTVIPSNWPATTNDNDKAMMECCWFRYHQTSPHRGICFGSKEHLELVSLRNCTEDANYNGCDDDRYDDGLQEDGVLDLAKSGLLNPHLAVEHLPDNIALVVFGNPWFIFVAVMGAKAVE